MIITEEPDGSYRLTVPYEQWKAVLTLAWFYVENQGLDLDDAMLQALQDEERWGIEGVLARIAWFAAMRETARYEA